MKSLLFLFLLFPFLMKAQNESITQRHHIQHNEKSYYFFVTDKQTNFDNTKFYHWYRAQRIRETQGGASGELLHGNFEVYFKNKQLETKGSFKKGLKHGEWKSWRENGVLEKTTFWNNGEIRKESNFNDDGVLINHSKYGFIKNSYHSDLHHVIYSKDSLKVKVIDLDENGKKLNVTRTVKGKLHGTQKKFVSGEGYSKEKYKNDALVVKKAKPKKEEKEKISKEAEPRKPKQKKPRKKSAKNIE